MPPPNHSERIESLEDQVRSLLAALEAHSAPAPPPSENASVQHSFRSKEPEVFTGEQGHLEPFLAQVDVFLQLNPGHFINDSDLILWLSTLLRGIAHQWFYPHLSAVNPPAWLTDYPLFINQLRVVFGDPDRIATAKREIEALSQTTSVSGVSRLKPRSVCRDTWRLLSCAMTAGGVCGMCYRRFRLTSVDTPFRGGSARSVLIRWL
ncbi:uncharacterized protein UHOD_12108 [Ustilago sp. UG-2017b]|nr:uncharacterized protein UHOD_12108 [Ustilago sp. UG-2017b]